MTLSLDDVIVLILRGKRRVDKTGFWLSQTSWNSWKGIWVLDSRVFLREKGSGMSILVQVVLETRGLRLTRIFLVHVLWSNTFSKSWTFYAKWIFSYCGLKHF